MRLVSKVQCFYVLILILFTCFYVFLRPRPKLNSFSIKESNIALSNYKIKNNISIFNPSTNKVNVGKIFSIKDNENWYQVIQLSFWRKEYLNLDFINNQLNISDINVKSINSNNYALGILQGEEIAFSCMKNPNQFKYTIPKKKVDSLDINYWMGVYIKNLNLIFNSFKPKNYQCYLVFTTDKNFFKNSDIYIKKKIFDKFIYE